MTPPHVPSANWVLAHKLLPRLMVEAPQGMDPRTKATLAEADQVLAGMWRAAQAMSGPAFPIPPTAARVRVAGVDTLAVCFLALQANDAHYALSAPVGPTWRYLTLEKPLEGDGAFVGEWAGDRHVNHGRVEPPVDLAAFLGHCARVLGCEVTLVEGPAVVSLTGTMQPTRARPQTWPIVVGLAILSAALFGLAWML